MLHSNQSSNFWQEEIRASWTTRRSLPASTVARRPKSFLSPFIYDPAMDADFAVELGSDDETLEFPWFAPEGPRYLDLKRNPELIGEIEEARRAPPLRDFLLVMNSPATQFETAKCDIWFTHQLNPEEEIYGAAGKFCSYVDLIFAAEPSRYQFEEHEKFASEIARLLKRAPEMPAAAEFSIRRCFFHQPDASAVRDGCYLTFYLFGYGNNEGEARRRWTIALNLAANAIRQWSARTDRE
jgi:hypothetical protein